MTVTYMVNSAVYSDIDNFYISAFEIIVYNLRKMNKSRMIKNKQIIIIEIRCRALNRKLNS